MGRIVTGRQDVIRQPAGVDPQLPGVPRWVRYAQRVLQWWPEHSQWADAEVQAWERVKALAANRRGEA